MMGKRTRPLAGALVGVGLALFGASAGAQVSGDKVVIGVLNDQSGLYADFGGRTSIDAARMAVEEFGGTVLGKPIEVIAADHENSKDKATALATDWFDKQGVDVVTDLTNSGVALAIQELARTKNRVALFSGPATGDLTGKACSPVGIHWTFDTYSQAVGAARALVKEGGDSWFVMAVDYAFGLAMEEVIVKTVQQSGGKITGKVRHPLNAEDFSKFLMDAQSSRAKVVALASAGTDTVNAIKQASILGLTDGGQTLAALVMVISDIHSIGLDDTKGLTFVSGFYWDRDDASRAFAKKFNERNRRMPGMVQAGVYSSVLHYLKAVQAAGTDEAKAVVAKMKELPVNDAFAQNGRIRADGRMVHDMYLVRVKTPQESKAPWDYYKVIRTIPADEAFRPLAEGGCPLVK